MSYRVVFHEFATKEPSVIYEDRSVAVTTIPLQHRIPCCGFLFAEKPRPNHIIREMIDFYQVPVYELNRIKNGEDFVTPEGDVIANSRLTRPSASPRRYAYCSDTIYRKEIVQQISGVDLLFHEATFAQTESARAKGDFPYDCCSSGSDCLGCRGETTCHWAFLCRYENEQVLLDEAAAIFPSTILAKENLCINL